jgi:hypothetical protein
VCSAAEGSPASATVVGYRTVADLAKSAPKAPS